MLLIRRSYIKEIIFTFEIHFGGSSIFKQYDLYGYILQLEYQAFFFNFYIVSTFLQLLYNSTVYSSIPGKINFIYLFNKAKNSSGHFLRRKKQGIELAD
jgi:hypothetical protein